MKSHFCLLAAVTILCCCSTKEEKTGSDTQKSKNDLEFFELKGDVKSLFITEGSAKNRFEEVIMDEKESHARYEFNEDGNIRSQSSYDENGELSSKTIYTYDGKLLKESNTYTDEGELGNRIIFENNGENIIKETTYNKHGDIVYILKYEYDGKITTRVTEFGERFYYYNYNNEEEPIDLKKEKLLYEYANDGKEIIKSTEYNNDTVVCIRERTTAENGNLLWREYDKDGQATGAITEFDSNERFARKTNGKGEVAIIERDSNGKIVKCVNCEASSTGHIYVTFKNETFYYEYETDKTGNWTKRITYKSEGRIPVEIVEREITYWP